MNKRLKKAIKSLNVALTFLEDGAGADSLRCVFEAEAELARFKDETFRAVCERYIGQTRE